MIYEDFEYNNRGLLRRQSVPHFSTVTGSNIKWSESQYDRLGGVSLLNRADGVNVATTYTGLQSTTLLNGGQQKIEIVNALGEPALRRLWQEDRDQGP